MTTANAPLTNPYVGPRSFQLGETLYGRDREVRDLLGLLIAERIVLLHSPSGAGKTSLVQAALIPQLIEQDFSVLPPIRVSLEPLSGESAASATAPRLNRYVYSALFSLDETLPPEQLQTLTLAEYLEQRPRAANVPESEVLIFDQFEEILTIDPHNQEAKHEFFRQLGLALRARHRWALFVMRDDYVASLAPYLRPVPTRLSTTFRLDLLGVGAARQAMRQPAAQVGIDFNEEAATRLIDDLRRVQVQRSDGSIEEQPGANIEPVQLQVVCYRLWERCFNGTTTGHALRIGLEDILALGDVNLALADYYAERVALIARQSGISERVIRLWVERQLITAQGLRGQVLQEPEQSQGLDNQAIRALIDAYLVRAEKRRGATWFELAHDRLIGPVRSNNAAWFQSHLSLLQRQADLWDSQDRPAGLLLRDHALVEAEAWANAHPAELTAVEHAFLEECREARRLLEKERRTNLRIRRLTLALAIFGVAAVVLAVFALIARDSADKARREAETALNLAKTAQTDAEMARVQAEGARAEAEEATTESQVRLLIAQSGAPHIRAQYPQRALLLALASVGLEDPPRPGAVSALQYALAFIGGLPLAGHSATIQALAFSPDGTTLATASADNTLRLWDMRDSTAAPIVLDHAAPVTTVSFSPDGRWLATGSADAKVQLWERERITDGPKLLNGHSQAISALVFNPDSRLLASGDTAGSVQLWQLDANPPAAIVLEAHSAAITALAFSPNGRLLASGSSDTTARLWNVADPRAAPRELSGHSDGITALAFSPDGRSLATGSRDKTARLWNVADPQAAPREFTNHTDWVTTLSFSPDARWFATGSSDQTVLLWDLEARDPQAPPRPFSGHGGSVNALLFTPDSATLVAADALVTQLWDVGSATPQPTQLHGHERFISAVALSPDGRLFATGDEGGSVRLWHLAQVSAVPQLQGPSDLVTALAFSPDNRFLAAASKDTTVLLWDRNDLDAAPQRLEGHEDLVATVLFSPDGQRLATGSFDGTVRLWNLNDLAAAPQVLQAHATRVLALAFDASGSTLFSASNDGAVYRWNLAEVSTPVQLRAASGTSLTVGLSSDGHYLATAGLDNIVQVWDLTQPDQAALQLPAATASIHTLSFSPDGSKLALAIDDMEAGLEIWNLRDVQADPLKLQGYLDRINVLAFRPDGQALAAGSANQIQIWDLSQPDATPVSLDGHDDTVLALAFSPDSRVIATGGGTTTRIWLNGVEDMITLACQTVGRNLTRDEWQQIFDNAAYEQICPNLPAAPPEADGS